MCPDVFPFIKNEFLKAKRFIFIHSFASAESSFDLFWQVGQLEQKEVCKHVSRGIV